eukprot:1162039-Pelagomonas_calceolata.AAC.8
MHHYILSLSLSLSLSLCVYHPELNSPHLLTPGLARRSSARPTWPPHCSPPQEAGQTQWAGAGHRARCLRIQLLHLECCPRQQQPRRIESPQRPGHAGSRRKGATQNEFGYNTSGAGAIRRTGSPWQPEFKEGATPEAQDT